MCEAGRFPIEDSSMTRIAFLGAGSTVFARNILGDVLLRDGLHEVEIALYDIDRERLEDSARLIQAINDNQNQSRAQIHTYLGPENRRAALQGAAHVVNAIQVGGFEPCTVTDFEIPDSFGLRQTIADTIGIGGLFRTLRTLPVLLEIARDMEEVCPEAWLLNYTNPMCAVTAGLLQGSSIRTMGLCHSVQACIPSLMANLGLDTKYPASEVEASIAGINHQAWLLRVEHHGADLYPEIKERARALSARVRDRGGGRWVRELLERTGMPEEEPCYMHPFWALGGRDNGKLTDEEALDVAVGCDLVRFEILARFGYYLTESSEHTAEYTPWFVKAAQPALINEYNIPLDEYPRRCRQQIAGWAAQREALLANTTVEHTPSNEFGASILHALITGEPTQAALNVMNEGWIDNLPTNACVEVPSLVDADGIHPEKMGALPEPCAALNRTNIGTQILAVEAVLHRSRDAIYQAALLDPHTGAELSVDQTVALCDQLIDAHAGWLPEFR